MTIDMFREFFLWCLILNMCLLMLWFLIITLGHSLIYRVHGKWFKMPEEKFYSTHYKGMMYFKISIFLFNLVPYLALLIIK